MHISYSGDCLSVWLCVAFVSRILKLKSPWQVFQLLSQVFFPEAVSCPCLCLDLLNSGAQCLNMKRKTSSCADAESCPLTAVGHRRYSKMPLYNTIHIILADTHTKTRNTCTHCIALHYTYMTIYSMYMHDFVTNRIAHPSE